MPLTLRPATAADLPVVAALMNRAYRGSGPDASWNTEAPYLSGDRTSEADLAQDLAATPEAFLLIAENDVATEDEVATEETASTPIGGCVWLKPLSPATWYLGSLTIDPRLQNSGLGRTLLAAAELWAMERGAQTMQMEVVNLRDTLIAWYERRGYRLTGETHPFPYGDNRFGTPLRDDLHFVVMRKPLTSPL